MRILINGINFFPGLTGIGKYTGEMAFYLMDNGYDVRIVTAPPYYPHWVISEGYSEWRYTREYIKNVLVYRCPLWVPSQPSGINRIFHLTSFILSSLPIMLSQVSWKPDLVLGVAPTFFSTLNVLMVAGLTKANCWLHIQDFELDAAFELGILPGSNNLHPLIKILESNILHKFDRVSTISNSMALRLQQKGLAQERIVLFPNWVDTENIYPLKGKNPMRSTMGISDEQVVVLYSGNMGHKQGLEILIHAAKILKNESNLYFVLCGDGASRRDLEETSKGLNNVRFIPLQPVEELNSLLNLADIHVLPQRAGAADLVMPSKLSGMLASGRPVIVTADEKTELAQVVNGIGFVVAPGDDQSLAEKIILLAGNIDLRYRMGQLSRKYVEVHWSKENVLGGFIRQLESLIERSM